MKSTPTAFVIMPFDPEFNDIYESLIKKSLIKVGYEVRRADSLLDQRNILREIVVGITNADLVVADLTANNPNVFYELGLCHALDRPTVLLAQSISDVPFDLRSYKVHIYDTHFSKITKLGEFLTEVGKKHRKHELSFANPLSDFAVKQEDPTVTDILADSSVEHNEKYAKVRNLIVRYLERVATSAMSVEDTRCKQIALSLEKLVMLKPYYEQSLRQVADDAYLLDTLLDVFGGRDGILRNDATNLRAVFQDGDQLAGVEARLFKAGFSTELTTDEEHGLWELELITRNQRPILIDWEFVDSPHFRDVLEAYMALENALTPLFNDSRQKNEQTTKQAEENELFDLLVEVESAANRLTKIIAKVLKDNELLNARITRHSANMQALTNSSTPGSAGRLHKLTLLASTDMNSFSKRLEDILPDFERTVEQLNEGYIRYLSLLDQDFEQNSPSVEQLRECMKDLLDNSRAAKVGVHSFREATLDLEQRKLSKDLSRASRRQAEALNGLILNIERVEAFSSKILGMTKKNEGA